MMLAHAWKKTSLAEKRETLGKNPVTGGCDYRDQSWNGWWESNIGREISKRKGHMLEQIIEKYII